MNARKENLPDAWCSAPLSDLGTWSGGGTPSKENSDFWRDGTIPWVSPKDMKVDRIHGSEDHITKEAVRRSAAKRLPAGSVLFVTRSSILAHTFPVAVTTVEVTVNQDLKAVVPHPGFSPEYVAWGSRALGGEILRRCSKDGTTVASIDTEQLMRFELSIAPFPEQRRIVEAIESYFTRLDDAVATLERVRRNLNRYRASVLKAAVEGRLVPTEAELACTEGREYEPASMLIGRVLAERRHHWQADGSQGRYPEPIAPAISDLPELPEGWSYSSIPMLVLSTRAGMKTGPFGSLLKKHEHKRSGVPVLGIENIEPMEFVPGSKIHITKDKAEQLSGYDVLPGDLLISRSGTVGQVCVAPDGLGTVRFSTNVMRVRFLLSSPVPEFVTLLLNGSPFVRDQITELCKGTTRDFLNQRILGRLVLPIPPLQEQVRILGEVARQLSVEQAVASGMAVAKRRLNRLRQSILKLAFEGRLVDQDPSDEPASVLLERIRSETLAGRASGGNTGYMRSRRGSRKKSARAEKKP